MKLLKLTICAITILFLWSCNALAYNYQFNLETMFGVKSEHVDQCQPNCYNQDNGGIGFFFELQHSNKHLNIGYGELYFKNSFNNEGKARIWQFDKAEYDNRYFGLAIAFWRVQLFGYDEDILIPLWPVFQAKINPLFFKTDKFYLKYHLLIFPSVTISWYGLIFEMEF